MQPERASPRQSRGAAGSQGRGAERGWLPGVGLSRRVWGELPLGATTQGERFGPLS